MRRCIDKIACYRAGNKTALYKPHRVLSRHARLGFVWLVLAFRREFNFVSWWNTQISQYYMIDDQVPHIGHMAGRIWHELDINGPMSVSALVRRIDRPRDYVMEGIGWLAREGKISIRDEGRIRLVTLIAK